MEPKNVELIEKESRMVVARGSGEQGWCGENEDMLVTEYRLSPTSILGI